MSMSRFIKIFLAALALGVMDVWRASAATTNVVVFSETMALSPAKPWTGGSCDNAWTVFTNGFSNPFEQNGNANYGSGHTNGLSFKVGTTNLADSSITTTAGIDARGDSAIAKTFSQCWKWSHLVAASCTKDQKERFLKPFMEDDGYLLGKGGTYRSFDKVLEIPAGHFAEFGDWSRLALMRNKRTLAQLAFRSCRPLPC